MTHFRDLKPEEFRDAVVFLDLDGTLVVDGADELAPKEAHTLATLTTVAQVYLVSNKGLGRIPALAKRYGAEAIVTDVRKPSKHVLDGVALPRKPRIVIGDKMMTDGWFAHRIGARFVKVQRLTDGRESAFVRLTYAVDALVWVIFSTVHIVRDSTLWAYLTLARPRQWVKNLLIPTPLFFAGEFLNIPLLISAAIGVIAFSASASAGYVINDILDADEDRRHPTKQRRPLAARRIGVGAASAYALVLAVIAVAAASLVPPIVPWIVTYLVLTYAYSLFLKRIPVLETVVVACFYLVRILAGGAIAAVPISGWLILTTLFASLFVTAGKRYAESRREHTRSVIRKYSDEYLRILPAVTGTLAILAYALYSILGATHHLLVYSNLFVIFGILWYLRNVYSGRTEDPEEKLWSDLMLLGTVLGWGVYVAVVMYGPQVFLLPLVLWRLIV